MNLTIEPRESHVLARIEDTRLDALSAPDFKARMSGALTGTAPKVVLDLSPVAFIDSAGLASILSLVKGLPEGGDLRIAGARGWRMRSTGMVKTESRRPSRPSRCASRSSWHPGSRPRRR